MVLSITTVVTAQICDHVCPTGLRSLRFRRESHSDVRRGGSDSALVDSGFCSYGARCRRFQLTGSTENRAYGREARWAAGSGEGVSPDVR